MSPLFTIHHKQPRNGQLLSVCLPACLPFGSMNDYSIRPPRCGCCGTFTVNDTFLVSIQPVEYNNWICWACKIPQFHPHTLLIMRVTTISIQQADRQTSSSHVMDFMGSVFDCRTDGTMIRCCGFSSIGLRHSIDTLVLIPNLTTNFSWPWSSEQSPSKRKQEPSTQHYNLNPDTTRRDVKNRLNVGKTEFLSQLSNRRRRRRRPRRMGDDWLCPLCSPTIYCPHSSD